MTARQRIKWLAVLAAIIAVQLGFCISVSAQGGASPPAQWTPPEIKPRDWGTAGWSRENTMLFAVGTGLDAMAAQQTVECMRLTSCYEIGPLSRAIYGPRQQINEVWKFFLMKTAAKGFFLYQVDEPLRKGSQGIFIGVSALDVRHNQQEKLKPDWGSMWTALGVGIVVSYAFY